MTRVLRFAFIALILAAPAAAQDIRGLEVCTAEKSMERRTGCLQSNVEFLQQALAKYKRETQAALAAAARETATYKVEIATLKSEVAALKTALTKLQQELTDLKKPKPEKK